MTNITNKSVLPFQTIDPVISDLFKTWSNPENRLISYNINNQKKEAVIVYETPKNEIYRQKIMQIGNAYLRTITNCPDNLSGEELTSTVKSFHDKGLKQIEIAEIIKKSQTTISRILKNKKLK